MGRIYLPARHAARDYIYIMSGFFEELQRRKVYRVAAVYIVVAGFLIQIASAAFPAWELPSWSLRLVIALLLIGFPIALILAWAYDVTPQGIQATARVPGAHPAPQSYPPRRHRRDNLYGRGIFPVATPAAARKIRQVNCGSAIPKCRRRKSKRVFHRWHPERDFDKISGNSRSQGYFAYIDGEV